MALESEARPAPAKLEVAAVNEPLQADPMLVPSPKASACSSRWLPAGRNPLAKR
jgi:hypothetical protein